MCAFARAKCHLPVALGPRPDVDSMCDVHPRYAVGPSSPFCAFCALYWERILERVLVIVAAELAALAALVNTIIVAAVFPARANDGVVLFVVAVLNQ
jgi:hypothetical protein